MRISSLWTWTVLTDWTLPQKQEPTTDRASWQVFWLAVVPTAFSSSRPSSVLCEQLS
jgi:hypothetical protein